MKQQLCLFLLIICTLSCVQENTSVSNNSSIEIKETADINIPQLFTKALDKTKTATERREELFQIRKLIVHQACNVKIDNEAITPKRLYEQIRLNKYNTFIIEDYQLNDSIGKLTYLKIKTSTNE